jgi:hypothetical protein
MEEEKWSWRRGWFCGNSVRSCRVGLVTAALLCSTVSRFVPPSRSWRSMLGRGVVPPMSCWIY